ncbi:MAG: hypothetical protein AAFR88_03605, partial [Pseudomonadota bacterium]
MRGCDRAFRCGQITRQSGTQVFLLLGNAREAFIIAIAPPSVRGVGTGGGFKLQLRETESADMRRVLNSAYAIMG